MGMLMLMEIVVENSIEKVKNILRTSQQEFDLVEIVEQNNSFNCSISADSWFDISVSNDEIAFTFEYFNFSEKDFVSLQNILNKFQGDFSSKNIVINSDDGRICDGLFTSENLNLLFEEIKQIRELISTYKK